MTTADRRPMTADWWSRSGGGRQSSVIGRLIMPIPLPLEITKTGAQQLTVRWDDGHTSVYPIKHLRAECTCAMCVNELTGARQLDPATIAEDITVIDAQHVGRYGVRFKFSDRHDDGIYTWERLRAICQCEPCRARQADE